VSNAPVCLIQPVISTSQPPPLVMPSIPQANDLASALAAINALSTALRYIQSQLPPNTPNIQGPGGMISTNSKKGGPAKQGRWNQLARVTEQVKVTNPSDSTQFVIIDRIKSLTMKDSVTGETWVWTR